MDDFKKRTTKVAVRYLAEILEEIKVCNYQNFTPKLNLPSVEKERELTEL